MKNAPNEIYGLYVCTQYIIMNIYLAFNLICTYTIFQTKP